MPQQPESSSLTSKAGDAGQGSAGAGGAEQGFLVAVAVEQDRAGAGVQGKLGDGSRDHARKSSTRRQACGDGLGVGAKAEVAVFVDEGDEAAWLDAQDGDALAGGLDQAADALLGQLAGEGQQALGDRRAAAAAHAGQADGEAGGFQQADGRDAGGRGVVGGEAVVDEDDRAALARAGVDGVAAEPAAEVVAVKGRQGAPEVDAQEALGQDLERFLMSEPVGEGGDGRGEGVQAVDVAQQPVAQGQGAAVGGLVEDLGLELGHVDARRGIRSCRPCIAGRGRGPRRGRGWRGRRRRSGRP